MKSRIYGLLALAAVAAIPDSAMAQSLIVNQDFEADVFPPQGWTVIDNDGDGKTWLAQSGSSYVTQYSGSKTLAVSYTRDPASYNTSYGQQDNWLITPAFEVKNAQYVVQFVYAAQDLDKTEPMSVLVSEGGTDVADFTEIWSTTIDNGYDDDIQWSQARRALSAYSGKTVRVAVRHKANGTYGLSVDNFYVLDQTGPMQPTAFTATAATDGKKEVTLKWTNPSKTALGDNLENLTIVVYRDGQKVTELTDRKPGEADSYVDTTTDGTHVYTIAAANASGEGMKVGNRSVFLGEDVAKPASDVVALVQPDGTVKVSWVAPTKSVNNGYVDFANLRYNVFRGEEKIGDKVEGTTFVDANPAVGSNYYTVSVVTGGGESAVDYGAGAYVPAAGVADVLIGQTAERDNSLERLAWDIYSSYSVNQSIYYPSDFNYLTGEITDIVLKGFHGTSSPITMKGRVYITSTTLDELTDWAPLTAADEVFNGEVTLEQGAGDAVFHLAKPFDYTGGNIVVTWIKDGKPTGGYSDRFYSVNTDKANRTFLTSTYSAVDIASMPHGYSDKSCSQIPSTRFIVTPKAVGALEGTVTTGAGADAVAGALVSVAGYDGLCTTTGDDGKYSFRYVPVAAKKLVVTKVGYKDGEAAVALTDGGSTTANVVLERYANFTLSGKVTTEDTGLNAAGAIVAIAGYEELSGTVGADGRWSIPGVYVDKDYTISVSYPLYDVFRSEFTYSGTDDKEFNPVVLERALIPAWNVNVAVAEDGSQANITWNDPTSRDVIAGMKSIGDVSTQKYTGGDYSATNYCVGHAFSEEALAEQKMVGLVVKSVRVFIKATAGTFTAKIWRGTRASHEEVAAQLIPASEISADGAWVTVIFDNPAEIKPGSAYLVGVEADAPSSSPFGQATSSYISGGNNLKWSETTSCYDGYSPWCIQAICEVPGTDVEIVANPDAPKCAYNVYRGLAADGGETGWTKLTTSPVSDLAFADPAWASQESGRYVYAVTAVYNKVGESARALSQDIVRAVDTDVALTAFISPQKSAELQDKVSVKVSLTNHGELPVEAVPVALSLNGKEVLSATYSGTLRKGESAELALGEITLAAGLNVLSATAKAEGDQVAANDVLVFELPNFANVALRGYRWDAYGNAGFMEFGSNNPEGASYKMEVTPNDALIISGETVNGTFYGYTATWWGESREFVEIDPANFVVSRTVENTDDYVLDMAYDYSSGVMYCLATYGADVHLGTVNLATGMVEPVGALGRVFRTLACNLDGRLFAIDETGCLYTIDGSSAAATLVGDTGAGKAVYLQSMAFDHNSGRLFWARTASDVNGELLEIDPATAEATRMGTVMFGGYDPSEIVALYSPYTAPAKSFAAVTVSPADGEALSEFAGVTITYPGVVNAVKDCLAATYFSANVGGWNSEGNGTATVRVYPTDASGAATTVKFEPEKTYTLSIPEGAFVMPNGDFSEALNIKYESSVSGIENVSANTTGTDRYFNLQGVEISTPAAGEVYIILHPDGTTTKQLIK